MQPAEFGHAPQKLGFALGMTVLCRSGPVGDPDGALDVTEGQLIVNGDGRQGCFEERDVTILIVPTGGD